ncbi:MAG: hypothetical protein Q8L21_01190, partial [Candidatus Komeilibacteria bacterium]|nr:hypothetical protein [Candidatus Komeilibacteria bacterium]
EEAPVMTRVGEVEILTHNGRPLSQGGKRIGYRLLRRDGTVWEYWTHPGLAAQANRQAQKQAKKRQEAADKLLEEARQRSLPNWQDFPKMTSAMGWCSEHRMYYEEVWVETRQGMKPAWKCPDCGTLYRPR